MIPDDTVERVRESADIVGVIGEYVQLKRTGEAAVAVPPTPTLAPPRQSPSAKPKCPQGERFIYEKCEHL